MQGFPCVFRIIKDNRSSKVKSVEFYTATRVSSHKYVSVLCALHLVGVGVIMREMFESIQSGVPVLDLGFDGNCSDALQEHIKIQNQMDAVFTGTTLRHISTN